MAKIRQGSKLTTFVWWNQPKLKPGEQVKVSSSTLNLAKVRSDNKPQKGDTVIVAWYFMHGPCRKRKGVLLGVYAYAVACGTIDVGIVDFGEQVMRVDLSRVSKAKP